jgi:hypothetical protein
MKLRRGIHPNGDKGAILPLVLVFSTVLAFVVVALASYATTGLKYGGVVEDRADRLAAADVGIRYAVEQLRLLKSDCTTALGSGSGTTAPFPPDGSALNGAAVSVNCQRVGAGAADTQGWAAVITGGTSGTGQLRTQGGIDKEIGGRVYLHDEGGLSLSGGDLTIENGDLHYVPSTSSCPDATPPTGVLFNPSGLRGPICTTTPWTSLFTAPVPNVPTAVAPGSVPDDPDGVGGLEPCQVFYPGKYTASPTLGSENYFRSGEYYFEDANLLIDHAIVIAGYADGTNGDAQSFTSQSCANAQSIDRADGGAAGVTIYLGGSSAIQITAQGELEILRRNQGDAVVSVQALDSDGSGYVASTLGITDAVIDVQSGSQQDFAAHGLIWAPRAYMKLDNVANKAQGQTLGGLVIGSLEMQSSNGDGLLIRVEPSPAFSRLMLTSTATSGGTETKVRAIAQVEPDTGDLVLNSWRVCAQSGC